MTFANRRLLQNSIIELFKTNLVKKVKKRKDKTIEKRVTYNNAFERVFIQIMIQTRRLKKKKKTQKIFIRKKIISTRKFVVVVKKQIIANNKIKRVVACAIKKTQKNEKNRLKALSKKTRITKIKNKKKKTDVSFASQKNLSAFQFSNVLINLEILETKVYLDSNAFRVVANEVDFILFHFISIS